MSLPDAFFNLSTDPYALTISSRTKTTHEERKERLVQWYKFFQDEFSDNIVLLAKTIFEKWLNATGIYWRDDNEKIKAFENQFEKYLISLSIASKYIGDWPRSPVTTRLFKHILGVNLTYKELLHLEFKCADAVHWRFFYLTTEGSLKN